MRNLAVIICFLIILTSLGGCQKKSDLANNPDYITPADQAETAALADLQGQIQLPASLLALTKDWSTVSIENKNISFKLPDALIIEKKESSPDYVSRYVIQEKNISEKDKAPFIEIKIVAGDFARTLDDIENSFEVNSKRQVTINNIVGVELKGVSSGQIVTLLPWPDKVIIFKNFSLKLQDQFLAMVSTLTLSDPNP